MSYALDLKYGRQTLTVHVCEQCAPGDAVFLDWNVENAESGQPYYANTEHLVERIRRAIRITHEWRVERGLSRPLSPSEPISWA